MNDHGDITNDQIGAAGFNPFLELCFSKAEAQRITAALLHRERNGSDDPKRSVTDLLCSGMVALVRRPLTAETIRKLTAENEELKTTLKEVKECWADTMQSLLAVKESDQDSE